MHRILINSFSRTRACPLQKMEWTFPVFGDGVSFVEMTPGDVTAAIQKAMDPEDIDAVFPGGTAVSYPLILTTCVVPLEFVDPPAPTANLNPHVVECGDSRALLLECLKMKAAVSFVNAYKKRELGGGPAVVMVHRAVNTTPQTRETPATQIVYMTQPVFVKVESSASIMDPKTRGDWKPLPQTTAIKFFHPKDLPPGSAG